MNERVLLLSSNSILRSLLESEAIRVMDWPPQQIQLLQNCSAIDEAIENLYGYDWIILVNSDAVRFFLQRLNQLGRDVSDLDSLKVCAVEEATATALEEARIHVDVVAAQTDPAAIVEQLAAYVSSANSLDRLNFLLPQAAIGRDYLIEHLQNTGARADLVITYQTVATKDVTRLAALQSMLLTSSVDAVFFTNAEDVREFTRVFDTNNLSSLLRHVFVLTADDHTTLAAGAAGVSRSLQINDASANKVAEVLKQHSRA